MPRLGGYIPGFRQARFLNSFIGVPDTVCAGGLLVSQYVYWLVGDDKMLKEIPWDMYGENAQVLDEADIPVCEGCAYFCILKYEGIDQLISRLRIFDLDMRFHYMLYGHFSKINAIILAGSLPSAREEFDGVRCQVGQLEVSSGSFYGTAPMTPPATKYALKVVDPGNTTLARNEMYTVWGFGIRPCSTHETEIALFPEEEAVRRAIESVAEYDCSIDDERREEDQGRLAP
ncbi:hypothetical protein [Falsochrobactrum shanghaiense]|nr:hypothetical protein [Falsochrobactrum shanghaiense]